MDIRRMRRFPRLEHGFAGGAVTLLEQIREIERVQFRYVPRSNRLAHGLQGTGRTYNAPLVPCLACNVRPGLDELPPNPRGHVFGQMLREMASDAIQSGKHRIRIAAPRQNSTGRTQTPRISADRLGVGQFQQSDEGPDFLDALARFVHPVVAASLQTLVSASQLLADDPFQSATDGLIGLQAK
jgi:hypothetical protein